MNRTTLKELLKEKKSDFWQELQRAANDAVGFEDLSLLSAMRRKAEAFGIEPKSGTQTIRLAILGGYSLYPLHDILTLLLDVAGIRTELFLGDYDNYVAEILESEGTLYQFKPDVVFLIPGSQRCRYVGEFTDLASAVRDSANAYVSELLQLCDTVHSKTNAEILLANFIPPARHDPGTLRSRSLAADWSYRKFVNLEIGLRAPTYITICDLDFLACRRGTLASEDARGWFESKQPCSPALLADLCREASFLIKGMRRAPKKVLVLDLDNTLWGGVIADDGVEGIEIGDTSPRGEAFKAFQRQIVSLKQRGILLAVCSKNDHDRAIEPFEKHPEMVLKPHDFVGFLANWEPKSDNIQRLAQKLNLGLDSFVFVDDNPAEIEIVKQFVPEVSTLLLGPDPSEYAAQLQDSRLFESRIITAEDVQRTQQYRAESQRQELLAKTADMDSYLASLKMEATISAFSAVDVPRLAQLINKSNQFNLTTRRRSEAEVESLIGRRAIVAYSMRLRDRFGDHGLISVLIAEVKGDALVVDTWVMSCRVLKRQVEEVIINELATQAQALGCSKIVGVYLPTAKNSMVRDLYKRMGFQLVIDNAEGRTFELSIAEFQRIPTHIAIQREVEQPAH